MTLSRFLRDYLYIPLGGNKNGRSRRYLNLLITMALGGLWHGASWSFLFWGILHGFYLTVNHAWQSLTKDYVSIKFGFSYRILSWFVTFFAVVVGWVFFRATTFSGALTMLEAMFGGSGIALPPQIVGEMNNGFIYSYGAWLGAVGGARALILCALGVILVLLFPNLQQIFALYRPVLDKASLNGISKIAWHNGLSWAIIIGVIAGLSLSRLGNDTVFLYFNF